MGQLCVYLTPFASDYSGVCSALFDLKCITAINDAGCCTSHYVYYDEPRWDENVRPIFSTAIRNIDSILGNDDKIINAVCEAAENIEGEMISCVGTPVPALIGMDMDGIATEIEFRTGKPAFGFNTTGFDYYDKGIYLAGKALIDRFAEQKEIVKNRVNICGMTPLDYGACGNDRYLEEFLKGKGFEVGARFFMGITKAQVENCASAELNIAVSSSGLKIAKYLNKKFGTPFVSGFPVGSKMCETWPELPETLAKDDERETKEDQREKRVLIISDQIFGNSLRSALRAEIEKKLKISVATFFGFNKEEAEEGDLHFGEEADYLKLLKEKKYNILIADPDILNVPGTENYLKISFVHPAVSSQIRWNETELFNENFLRRIIDAL